MMASDAGTVDRVSACRRPARGGDVPQVKDELGNRLAKPDNSLSRPRLAVCPSSQWRAPKAEPLAEHSRLRPAGDVVRRSRPVRTRPRRRSGPPGNPCRCGRTTVYGSRSPHRIRTCRSPSAPGARREPNRRAPRRRRSTEMNPTRRRLGWRSRRGPLHHQVTAPIALGQPLPSGTVQGIRTDWLLIVIPRSRSMSIRSRYCARRRARRPPR